jgi:rhamnose transport system ATP-binding protein
MIKNNKVKSKNSLLSLSGINKSFPGVQALSNAKLCLNGGSVTALIGENGAGKSTIVKILTGIYQPDSGEISFNGSPVKFYSALDALKMGITAIHQETVLFDELTVSENIFLGNAPINKFGIIDLGKQLKKASEILQSINADIEPNALLKDLGIASRHLVAIARALSVDTKVVIMDEPTAALSFKEIQEIFALIKQLKEQGKAILFISHKFDEIFQIADYFTVFRDGEFIADGDMGDASQDELVSLMVGRSVEQIFPKRKPKLGHEIFSISDFSHPTEFADINFSLKEGEILGFYGLVGAGRSELMQAIFGITQAHTGQLMIEGVPVNVTAPSKAVKQGIVYVPEDRGTQGTIKPLPIYQNITLPSLATVSKVGFLQQVEEFQLSQVYTQKLDLRAASLDTKVENLSGGNQQKIVIAKWLATKPRIIILDEPTKGVDIGSKAAVHEFMGNLAANGLAVIMVSSEIPEILGMSDRIIVMRDGKIVSEHQKNTATPEILIKHAAGLMES